MDDQQRREDGAALPHAAKEASAILGELGLLKG
jgi:hypothetical protein